MSNALAIAGVTAVIKALLEAGITDNNLDAPLGGGVLVKNETPSDSGTPANRLNLLMYQAKENPALRNECYPAYDGRGNRVENAPLALDLQYIITAYGSSDYHADLLLGAAMQVMHEKPMYDRALISSIINTVSVGTLNLGASNLANQIESIRVTPQKMGGEEMSRIWSAFMAPYRPSAVYQVSVVLIEAEENVATPPAVLSRGSGDSGVAVQSNLVPPIPTLENLTPPNSQTSVVLTDTLTLAGHDLDGSNQTVVFDHRLSENAVGTIAPATSTAKEWTVAIPNDNTWPAGYYEVSANVRLTGETFTRTTNSLSLALSPSVTTITPNRVNANRVDIALVVAPQVQPGQSVSLIVGSNEFRHDTISAATANLSFTETSLAAGDYVYRLRVDGVESIYIDRTTSPPSFPASATVTIP